MHRHGHHNQRHFVVVESGEGRNNIILRYRGRSSWGAPLIKRVADDYLAQGVAALEGTYREHRLRYRKVLDAALEEQAQLTAEWEEVSSEIEAVHGKLRRGRVMSSVLSDSKESAASLEHQSLQYARIQNGLRLADLLRERRAILDDLSDCRYEIVQLHDAWAAAQQSELELAQVQLLATPVKTEFHTAQRSVGFIFVALLFCIVVIPVTVWTLRRARRRRKIRTLADAISDLGVAVIASESMETRSAA